MESEIIVEARNLFANAQAPGNWNRGRNGAPRAYNIDGLVLFGATPPTGSDDVRSQFQCALLDLGIAKRVAPDPQAKGKIERRFGTFQNRLVSLLRVPPWRKRVRKLRDRQREQLHL